MEQFPPEQLEQGLEPLVVTASDEGLPATMGPPVLNLHAEISFSTLSDPQSGQYTGSFFFKTISSNSFEHFLQQYSCKGMFILLKVVLNFIHGFKKIIINQSAKQMPRGYLNFLNHGSGFVFYR